MRFCPRAALPVTDFAAGVPADIAERVRRMLAAVCESAYAPPRRPVDPSRLRMEDSLAGELGYDLDSLSMAELVMKLEDEFGIRLRTENLLPNPPRSLTVGDVVRAVAERLAAGRSA